MNNKTSKLIRKAILKTFSKRSIKEKRIRYQKAKRDWCATKIPLRNLTRKVLKNLTTNPNLLLSELNKVTFTDKEIL
jgi:hypothetical protein